MFDIDPAKGPQRLEEVRARMRLAYFQGAEDWGVGELRRRLSADELELIV